MRPSVPPRPQLSFGERFAFYAHRVRTLSLERYHEYPPNWHSFALEGLVSLEVLNA
jgi:hypothetical protein